MTRSKDELAEKFQDAKRYVQGVFGQYENIESLDFDILTSFILSSESIPTNPRHLEHLFYCMDLTLEVFVRLQLPMPELFRKNFQVLLKLRTANAKKKARDSISTKEKKARNKRVVLNNMLKIHIAGASIAKAAEIAAFINFNECKDKYPLKASTLEKEFACFVNDDKERVRQLFRHFTFESEEPHEYNQKYWQKVIRFFEHVNIPDDLKGNRRQ